MLSNYAVSTFNPCTIVPSQRLEKNYTLEVKQAFLQVIFDRGDLVSSSVPDVEIVNWVNIRLRPLLQSLTIPQVAQYFTIFKDRTCNTSQEG